MDITIIYTKGDLHMSAKRKLENFIITLTEEEAEKMISHLQELNALLEEPAPPYPPEQFAQNR